MQLMNATARWAVGKAVPLGYKCCMLRAYSGHFVRSWLYPDGGLPGVTAWALGLARPDGGSAVTVTIAQFLHASERIHTRDQATLNGFNGLHGGLAVAMLVREMRVLVPADKGWSASPRASSGRWPGRSCSMPRSSGMARRSRSLVQPHHLTPAQELEATATFGIGVLRETPCLRARDAGRNRKRSSAAAPFAPPAEFVPISRRMDNSRGHQELPYSGSADPPCADGYGSQTRCRLE